MNGPSINLKWAELACKDGTAYPEEFKLDGRIFKLAEQFEAIRTACGNLPITILSTYRSPAHNRKIGGAKNSQHVQGRALDLKPPKDWTVDKFYLLIRVMINKKELNITGIGKYPTFVHIDIRPSIRLVTWLGNGAKDDTGKSQA